MQKLVDALRDNDKVDAVVLLSHNGMDVDLKLASRVTRHRRHSRRPHPRRRAAAGSVSNAGGTTLVTNAGSSGKFLGVLDLDLAKGTVQRCALPAVAGVLRTAKPDAAMQALIDEMRGAACGEPMAKRSPPQTSLLYRRGNFNGTVDQLICAALRGEFDAESRYRRASAGARPSCRIKP